MQFSFDSYIFFFFLVVCVNSVVSDECYPLKSGQSEDTSMDKLTCELGYLQSYPCPNGDVTSELQRSSPPYRIGMNVSITFIMYETIQSYVSLLWSYNIH